MIHDERTRRIVQEYDRVKAQSYMRAAKRTGDLEREGFWYGVGERVRLGASLEVAMREEHKRRGGPIRMEYGYGGWHPADDLSVWYC